MFTEFEGTDLIAWGKHFQLSEACIQYLVESAGAKSVSDLLFVYEDPELMKGVEKTCVEDEYERFVAARQSTKNLWELLSRHPVVPENTTMDVVESHNSEASNQPSALKSAFAVSPESFPHDEVGEKQRTFVEEMNEKLERAEKTEKQLIKTEEAFLKAKEELRRLKDRNKLVIKKKEKIQLLEQQIRQAASLDVAFVLDCTSSMSPFIQPCKNKINEFVTEIQRLHSHSQLRLGFVAYRDHSNGPLRLEILNFTNSVGGFQRFVAGLRAIRDVDFPEDVLGGLNAASSLEWLSETRILYHITDAPCHGSEFHYMSDKYPAGCPQGLKPEEVLLALREKQITYYFGQIVKRNTEIMIKKFNALAGGSEPFIKVTDLNSANMMEIITETVSVVYSSSISSSSITDESTGSKREVVIDASSPDWKEISTEKVQKFSMSLPNSVHDLIQSLLENDEEKSTHDFPDDSNPLIKVAPLPFAKGATRVAYYGRLVDLQDSEGTPIVIKESLYVNQAQLTKQKYEVYLSCHRTATLLAKQFNEMKPANCPRIEFCDASILHFMARRGQPYAIMESLIADTFEKYNNNSGYCARNPTQCGVNHSAVQAFSHWTYCLTEERLMVVDCQGGYNRAMNTFHLTDPAIHFVDVAHFGGTNLGKEGFRKFLSNHVCNSVCHAFNLRPVAFPIAR